MPKEATTAIELIENDLKNTKMMFPATSLVIVIDNFNALMSGFSYFMGSVREPVDSQ